MLKGDRLFQRPPAPIPWLKRGQAPFRTAENEPVPFSSDRRKLRLWAGSNENEYRGTTNVIFWPEMELVCAFLSQDFYDSIDDRRSFFAFEVTHLVKKYSFRGSEDAIRPDIAFPV